MSVRCLKIIMKRILLRISLSLLTFIVGISLAAFGNFIYPPEPDINFQQEVSEIVVEQVCFSQAVEPTE